MSLCIFFFLPACSDGTRINHSDERRDVIIVLVVVVAV